MKTRIILAIVAIVLTVLTVKNESDVCNYQRATIAYVQGAERNGAISADESRYWQHLAGASVWVHAATRRGWCDTIRRAVDQAYSRQNAIKSDGSYRALSK